MNDVSVGVTQGSDGQKGATGLPGIRGNMVRIHITLHPVDIIYLIDHTKWCVLNKTTGRSHLSSSLCPYPGYDGQKGGERRARG